MTDISPQLQSAAASTRTEQEVRDGRGLHLRPIPSDEYLIWSHEHGAWWKANRMGYIVAAKFAGRFSRDEAIEICRTAREGFPMESAPSEIPVRAADVLACLIHEGAV